MATLTGKKIKNTYDALLKIDDNDSVTSTAKQITDGLGNTTPLYLSTTQLGIGVSPSFQLHTSSNAKIGGNLTVSGNLTVDGTTTIIDSTIIAIGDNMIEMAKDNVANTKDIGWYGTIVENGTKYVGMAYDASTGVTTPKFNLGFGTVEPGNTFATTVTGTLVANVEGTLTGIIASSTTATTQNANDNSTKVATTAYVDTAAGNYLPLSGGTMTGDIAMGTNNISGGGTATFTTFTGNLTGDVTGNVTGNVTGDVTGNVTGTVSSLSNHDTDDLSEGTTNLYFTTARARASFTEGTGVTITNGEIAIGQDVGTTSNVTFGNITGSAISGTTGTFSGQVTIPETPTADAHAASKKYVDDNSGDPDQTLAGVLSTGNTSGSNDIIMADSQKVNFGTDSDLFIVHSGTNGVIENLTGELFIQNTSDNKDIVFKSDNGSGDIIEYFRLDGSTNTIPFGRSPHITDNVKLYFGNDTTNDASIKWDSTASQLFIDGVSKFLSDVYFTSNAYFGDNDKLYFGDLTTPDLEIYHDTGNSVIKDNGTGSLYIMGSSSIRLTNVGAGEHYAKFFENGAVELMYDNSKKFETTSTGVSITGAGVFSGNVDVNGGQLNVTSSGGLGRIELGGASGGYIDLKAPASDDYDMRFIVSQGGNEITTASGDLKINTSNTLAITVNSSQHTSFRGNITLEGQATNNIYMQSSTANTYLWNIIARNDDYFLIGRSGVANDFYINPSGNATFTGSVTADSFIKDGGTSSQYLMADGSVSTGGTGVDGSGTANDVAMWSDSDTLTDAPIAISGNNAAFAGNIEMAANAVFTQHIKSYSSVRIDIDNDNNQTDRIFVVSKHNAGTELFRVDEAGDLTMQGGRIYLKESDLGNTAIALTRDADEGYVQLFSSGTQTIQIRGNGDTYFNGGAVGIGLTNPAVKLEIQDSTHTTMKIRSGNNDNILFLQALQSDEARIGTDTNSAISFFTNTSRRMTITTSGNCGIGINLPTAKLHIQGTNSANGGVKIQNSGGNPYAIYSDNNDLLFTNGNGSTTALTIAYSGNATFAEKITAQKGIEITGGSIAQSTAVLHTNNILYFRGGSNGLFLQNADGSDGYYISNTDHKWEVNGSEKMRLTSTGLGIGASSPDGNLEVVTTSTVSGASDSVNNVLIGLQSANRPTIILDTADTTYTNRTWNITNVGSAGSLFFGRNGLDVLVMKNDGKVGIGTTSPNEKLQVVGNIHAYAPSGIDAGLFASTAAGSTTIAIRSNGVTHFNGGAVGIGTTTPAFALHVSTTIGTRTLSLGHGTSYGIITTDAAKDLYFQQNGSTVFSLPSSGGLQMYGNTLKFDQTGTRSWNVFANYGYLNVAAGDSLGAFNLEGYTNFRINRGGIGYPRTNSINLGTAGWRRLGRWNTAQGGRQLELRINGGVGYNASSGQQGEITINLRTSNNSSSQSATSGSDAFYISGYYHKSGYSSLTGNDIRIVQINNSTYDIYMYVNVYLGESPIIAHMSEGTTFLAYTDTSGNTFSGVSYLDLPQSFRIQSVTNFMNSVAIGTTASPTTRLTVKDSQDSSFDSGISIIRSANTQTGYINMVGGAFNFNTPSGVPYKFRHAGTTHLEINGSGDATFAQKINAGGRILTEATTSNALLQVKYNSSNYLEGYYYGLNVVGGNFEFKTGGTTRMLISANSSTVGMGGTGIYTTVATLNLDGEGIAIKNDRDGSSNNWTYIRNTATGSSSNLQFVTGQGNSLTLNHNTSATFSSDVQVNGKIGINETAPATLLSLSGVKNTSIITLKSTTNNSSWSDGDKIGGINFYSEDGSGSGAGIKGSISYIAKSSSGGSTGMTFRTSDSSNNDVERMFIDNSGVEVVQRLGIQAINASYNLYNNGTTYLNGTTTIDATLYITNGRLAVGTPMPQHQVDAYSATSGIFAGRFVYAGTSGSDCAVLLRLAGGSTSPSYIDFIYGTAQTGSITTNGSSTFYLTSSDYRLKENVVELNGALDRIDNLKPKRFNFISDSETTVDGFLAHEVAEVVPEAIHGEKDAVNEDNEIIAQGIDQSKLVPLLVAAVQELREEVKYLKNEINKLK